MTAVPTLLWPLPDEPPHRECAIVVLRFVHVPRLLRRIIDRLRARLTEDVRDG